MQIPTKKLKSGFSMPVFGLGTWMMGGDIQRDPSNDKRDIQAIKNAIKAGITHIDTAEKYAEGHAEELVGQAIKRFNRKKLFIVTKVASDHLEYERVIRSCKNSLERLQTKYLDMFMLHSPSLDIPIKESMRAMDYLKKKGLIRNIAVSNFSVQRFKAAQKCTKNKIVANQLHYNLLIRENERNGLLKFCQENDVMFIAWRPVQKGVICKKGIATVDSICKKYKKTPAQIAINWLISQKNVVTLSKMSSAKHLKENLGALSWKMDTDDIELLRKKFPGQQDVSDSVPLSKYEI